MTSKFPGQEFCYAIKGTFEVIVDKKNYTINSGDGFYFNSKLMNLVVEATTFSILSEANGPFPI